MELYNADCLDVFKTINDGSIDLIVTDPPYRTITGGKNNGKNSNRPVGCLSNNNGLFEHQTDILIHDWMPELYRILKDGSHCYIFTNALCLKDMLIESENAGFKMHNLLVWEKNNCTPSQWYMKNCEYVLFLRKGKAKYINNISSKTVHRFNNIKGGKLHPTEKPIDLLEFYISNSSQEDDIVLDPFMGSGSTGVACKNLSRQFIGIEIDEKYFKIANKRILEE